VKRFLFAAGAVVVAAIVELAVSAPSVFHSGWFDIVLAALLCIAIATRPKRHTWSWAALLGCAIAGAAAISYGLFAPDDRTVSGAPGQRVAVEGLGTLVFPVAGAGAPMPQVALLQSHGGLRMFGPGALNTGYATLRETPRTVVSVEAFDARANHLTITQPQGVVFLSPILMMQHEQTISGVQLPFDSFNLPAAQRVVKAILFSPAEAAVMLHGVAPGQGAVLFAVDDENDAPLPHGIVLGSDGQTVHAGGLTLRATLQSYPAVTVTFTPNIVAVCAGALLFVGGVIGLALTR
jgi:hypothetical protein